MTPEQLAQFNEMQERLEKLERVENVSFIQSLERRLDFVSQNTLDALTLADLADVEGTSTASTGQVLKKTSTTWQPGTDNIA